MEMLSNPAPVSILAVDALGDVRFEVCVGTFDLALRDSTYRE